MTSVSLSKVKQGERVSLSKKSANLKTIEVGLGWKTRDTDGQDYDLDSQVFLCAADGKVTGIQDFIFFNNKVHVSGAVQHHGDNLSGNNNPTATLGDKANDCESITIDLEKIPQNIQQINFVVTIFGGIKRNQNFGQVNDAYIRIDDATNGGNPLVLFDLTENSSVNTAVICAQIYRKDGGWNFVGLNQGFVSGMRDVCAKFGVQAMDDED